jgi:hypothetical protein
MPRDFLETQVRLSRLFLSLGDQYLLSYDNFADELSAPSSQSRANIVQSQRVKREGARKGGGGGGGGAAPAGRAPRAPGGRAG